MFSRSRYGYASSRTTSMMRRPSSDACRTCFFTRFPHHFGSKHPRNSLGAGIWGLLKGSSRHQAFSTQKPCLELRRGINFCSLRFAHVLAKNARFEISARFEFPESLGKNPSSFPQRRAQSLQERAEPGSQLDSVAPGGMFLPLPSVLDQALRDCSKRHVDAVAFPRNSGHSAYVVLVGPRRLASTNNTTPTKAIKTPAGWIEHMPASLVLQLVFHLTPRSHKHVQVCSLSGAAWAQHMAHHVAFGTLIEQLELQRSRHSRTCAVGFLRWFNMRHDARSSVKPVPSCPDNSFCSSTLQPQPAAVHRPEEIASRGVAPLDDMEEVLVPRLSFDMTSG